MNIFLVGYMASGKSRLGKELANRMGYDHIDLDDLFEERYRLTIVDFFEKYGESNFRKMEHELLQEVVNRDHTIISTGGGTPCFYDNMSCIKSNGISIYLSMETPALVKRLCSVRKKRPLVNRISREALLNHVEKQMEQRAFFYNQADYIVNVTHQETDDLVQQIISLFKKENMQIRVNPAGNNPSAD